MDRVDSVEKKNVIKARNRGNQGRFEACFDFCFESCFNFRFETAPKTVGWQNTSEFEQSLTSKKSRGSGDSGKLPI
jgi:hypothetical protein